MDTFLLQASIYLLAAVIAVPIASRLGFGSVLGYLAAGLVIGPILGLVHETGDLQHFAEFGVVMMLFLIGLGRNRARFGTCGTSLSGWAACRSASRRSR